MSKKEKPVALVVKLDGRRSAEVLLPVPFDENDLEAVIAAMRRILSLADGYRQWKKQA